ncbi:tRNA lysidine(34) synthetase TilS [Tepidamorphus sp. 3E244]|uniref:tRNA lysidine(34) synthetase TilS n=1 Tax=Tepidamorphus sp. 3E244 TaxID=3385498 RepID=UPI0038FC4C22
MAAETTRPISETEAARLFAPLQAKPLALAVSGGPDSMAMAALAARWGGARLHALVVDHGLRAGSDAEARITAARLDKLGLAAAILTLSGLPQTNLHAAARTARYDAITDWMAAKGYDVLATAHHLDDQAETVAMRLERDRSAGADGIPAQGWWADRRLVRPLLGIEKARLRATLDALSVDSIEDPSNDDPRFERARVRSALAQGEAATPRAALLEIQKRAARKAASLDAMAFALASRALRHEGNGIVTLDVARYAGEAPDIRRRMLRALLRDTGGQTVPPAREKLARLDAGITSLARDGAEAFSGATLGGCLIARGTGSARCGTLVISRELGRMDDTGTVLDAGTAALFDRRFRIVCDSTITPGTQCRYGGSSAGDEAGLPAAARAAIPVLDSGKDEPCRLLGGRAGERGVRGAWLGIRFGVHRFA